MVEMYSTRAGDVKPVFKRASNAVKTRAKRPRGSKTTRYDEFGTVWRRTAPVAMDQPFAYIITVSIGVFSVFRL
jgi:hypothetical protein